MLDTNLKPLNSRGFSLVELLAVVTIIGILTAMAIPAMITQRRLLRSTMLMREIMTQLRYARQTSMSQRDSITFQYNDTTKQIRIINHNNNQSLTPGCNMSRTAILGASGFPDTTCSTVIATIPLTQGGLTAAELSYGIPTAAQLPTGAPVIPVTKLDDNVVMTALTPPPPASGGVVNITFQPDGSVIDTTGIPVDRALYFFNNKAPQATASAISVVGASGRVKIWRYTLNGNKFEE